VPRVSFFYGIVITMYFYDHQPPHFHAQYAQHHAVMLGHYRLRLGFSDGSRRDVDLTGELHGPIFEPLGDPTSSRRCGWTTNSALSPGPTAPISIHSCGTGLRAGLPPRPPLIADNDLGHLAAATVGVSEPALAQTMR
jgi:hypothetical protein